jgi:antitoxin component YwqK of YwqJK toxin-antitoxin module
MYFRDNKLNGNYITTTSSGKETQVAYIDGLKHGYSYTSQKYDNDWAHDYEGDSQIITTCNYIRGVRHGDYIKRIDGKITKMAKWDHGNKHGVCVNWQEDGDYVSIKNYQNGEKQGWWGYFEEKQPKTVIYYSRDYAVLIFNDKASVKAHIELVLANVKTE